MAPSSDIVRAEVTALGDQGPYRLTVEHSRGRIVEYFSSTEAALRRQGEIEALLAAARHGKVTRLKHAV